MEIKDKQKTRDSFLLVDSTIKLKKIGTLNKKYEKIITFDLESHRLLEKNLVRHDISEEYLDSNDELKIDSECIKLSQWHSNEFYSKQLFYEGINFFMKENKLFYEGINRPMKENKSSYEGK